MEDGRSICKTDGWLAGQLAGWQAGYLAGRLAGCQLAASWLPAGCQLAASLLHYADTLHDKLVDCEAVAAAQRRELLHVAVRHGSTAPTILALI